jgi:hypothetical protein
MRRRFLRLPPRLPLRTHVTALLVGTVVAMVATALVRDASAPAEALTAGGVVAAGTWIHLTLLLHAGARVDNGVVRWRWATVPFDRVRDGMADLGGVPSVPAPDGDEGAIAIILGILGALVLIVVLAVLAWILANAAILALGGVAVLVYAIACTGLRAALVHRRRCAGHWPMSALVAGGYAIGAGALVGLTLLATEAAVGALVG